MTLYRITLQMARNPGHPVGEVDQGYFIVAPLTDDRHLDLETWREVRDQCHVRRFHPDPDEAADGRLTHRGAHWRFHYDDEDLEGPDEEGYRLGDHVFEEGEYVTIHHHEDGALTYQVTDVTAISDL